MLVDRYKNGAVCRVGGVRGLGEISRGHVTECRSGRCTERCVSKLMLLLIIIGKVNELLKTKILLSGRVVELPREL